MQFLSKMYRQDVVTVVLLADGEAKQETVDSSHPNYKALRQAVMDNDPETFAEMLRPVAKLESQVVNGVRVSTGVVVDGMGNATYQGRELNHVVVKEIKRAIHEGRPVDTLKGFLEKLYSNPSSRAINELWGFIEAAGLTLTEDGCFLAYKSVKSDFYSKTSGDLTLLQGKVDKDGYIYNGVGETIECLRNEVDDEKDRTCSRGLHAGALEYAGPGGYFNNGSSDKCVIVKIDPKDVVSVPSDHSNQKLRTCKYEVVAEYQGVLNAPVYSGHVDYDNDDYGYDDEYEDDWEEEEFDEDTLEAEDMLVGHIYRFTYVNSSENSQRSVLITENDMVNEYVMGTLVYPEVNAGEVRRFNYDCIGEDIFEVEV